MILSGIYRGARLTWPAAVPQRVTPRRHVTAARRGSGQEHWGAGAFNHYTTYILYVLLFFNK